jgi:ferredoxin
MDAVLKLRDLVGEFDKPRFFRYQQRLCAHSRNEQIGCNACIEVCSARAICSDASAKGRAKNALQPAGGIIVEPHLCVGCGACHRLPERCAGFAPNTVDQPAPATAGPMAPARDAALLLHGEKGSADRRWVARRAGCWVHGAGAGDPDRAVAHGQLGLDRGRRDCARSLQVWLLLTTKRRRIPPGAARRWRSPGVLKDGLAGAASS